MKTLNRGTRNLLAKIPLLVIISLIPNVLGSGLPQSEAQNPEIYKKPLGDEFLVGITLDTNCQIYLKNNYTSNCPTYDQLNLFYPDLRCEYKGKLCLYHFRQIGKTQGYIIDPPTEVMDQIKVIEIRLNFEEFHLPGIQGYSNENNTINYGLSRYVDSCRTAYIDSTNWMTLTGDTIMYLYSGCTKTYINEGYTVGINQTEFSIADSYKYKLEQWQREVINKCGTKLCIYADKEDQPTQP